MINNANLHPPVPIDRFDVSAYTIPTDFPESDGTFEWDSTTIVVVQVSAGGADGLGYSYAGPGAAHFVNESLREEVAGKDAMAVTAIWNGMLRAARNIGRPGMASMGIAAVDSALWDLKARLLGLPLVTLLGSVRDSIPVYGSGGFTSYSLDQLQAQFRQWCSEGISSLKMKVGRDPQFDADRVLAARDAVGDDPRLFVDANGAYSHKQALHMAEIFADFEVTWFEEPVSSDDLNGLRFIRERSPAGMEIAAGEYGFDLFYFRRMLEAQAVDVLQADATRCAGITGFMAAGALCPAFSIPLSAHTAPSLHVHPCCALAAARDVEYFHDHVRIEQMIFDGAPVAVNGHLKPDRSRHGLGLELKAGDAEPFLVYRSAAGEDR